MQGNQLRRDLNLIVGRGKNWKIPVFWPVLLRYISGPVLAIIFSFAFPEFHQLRYDPMMITGFILSILGLTAIVVGCILPRYFGVLLPPERRDESIKTTVANEPGFTEEEVFDTVVEPTSDLERSDSGEGEVEKKDAAVV